MLAIEIPRPSEDLTEIFHRVRDRTEALSAPLSPEDQMLQSMPDASPAKWHRAHTTWFFETFILQPYATGYRSFDPAFSYLFNSYYDAVGPRHPRPARGVLSRPGAAEIGDYRAHVDVAMRRLLAGGNPQVAELTWIGINHEQQHQELLLTDIKHAFSQSSLSPAYRTLGAIHSEGRLAPQDWMRIKGGLASIGHTGRGFSFDNELPVHHRHLEDFLIADRPVSNGEYKAFIEDGGYRRPELWLSDGWAAVQAKQWESPGYWQRDGSDWSVYTLYGQQPVRDAEPVCHISYYEAAAYAEWAGRRLPTEFEWEAAAWRHPEARIEPDLLAIHPSPLRTGFRQDVWEWTSSAYSPYPRYRHVEGALGEYNGKFMVNQMVLRGRSCATPPGHDRPSYRNFFPPDARWQFSGVRLAADF